jgi:hypothetical protein
MTLIPSLSGGIYRFDGEDLSPMPMNVESLLQRSFKLPNDVILTGKTFNRSLSLLSLITEVRTWRRG